MPPEESKEKFLPPPIASPHGGAPVTASADWEGLGPYVLARCSLRSALLCGCLEIAQPLGLIVIFALSFIVEVLLPDGVPVNAFIVGIIVISGAVDYLMACRYIVELQPNGVWRRRKSSTMFLQWRQFLWIVDLGGNVWMATFATTCFIPRGAFASRAQSREFVRIVRELQSTNGAAWPTIFEEVSPQEPPRNLGTE